MVAGGGYVSIAKWPGIPAKSKCDKVFDVDLPSNQPKSGDQIGASYSGMHFNVSYYLCVFVKHDSWSEFGEGECVSFPIRIHQSVLLG